MAARSLAVLVLSGVTALTLGGFVTADAAEDSTPPVLIIDEPDFVTGTTISKLLINTDDGGSTRYTGGISVIATWSATDASGICGYRYMILEEEAGTWSRWGTRTFVFEEIYTYQGDQYGPKSLWVHARDCAGNVTEGIVYMNPDVQSETSGSFTGTWGNSTCACWHGGTTKRTTQRGAQGDFTINAGPAAFPGDSVSVALVMERAPDRGMAQILLDGVPQAVVDSYSATAVHRSVVWVGRIPEAESHTLSVVNMATPGRPRIDIDAVMISRDSWW